MVSTTPGRSVSTAVPASDRAFQRQDASSKVMQLVFVCTGNICRSPMAEIIVRDALEERGLDSVAKACSRGLGGWHVGQGADERAVAQLCSGGHDGASHRAAQLGEADLCADAFIAMDAGHMAELLSRGIDPARVFLLRSFDPHSPEGAEVEDPYYGSDADFARTRREIEAAVPGLLDWVSLHKD